MIDKISGMGLGLLTGGLAVARKFAEVDARLFGLTRRAWMQPVLAWACRMKALRVHRRAAKVCPAYRDFLVAEGCEPATRWSGFSSIPITDKANYVKQYSIEARCYGGEIPSSGVVIDESSGSSGLPNNWVRGRAEQASVRTLMQHAYRYDYGGKRLIVLNCFALGAWATGMNVTVSLADVAVIKSIGPDKERLDNTLRLFGPGYSYLIAGYPPFLKNYVDTAGVDLTEYDAHLIVGGEGMSEGLRDYLLERFETVRSSFGASDLEINIGAETALTIGLRRRCAEDAELCRALFGRASPPMVFQYNAADYFIETNAEGELIFTVARVANVSPKVRYNLRDEGGVMTFAGLKSVLAERGLPLADVGPTDNALPLLYVFGRSDMTVALYGANVYPADIEAVVNRDERLADGVNSFQVRVEERGDSLRPTLVIALERSESGVALELNERAIAEIFLEGLAVINQDFREVRKMFSADQLVIELVGYGRGCFAGRDIRVKSRYLG